jgi:hypothetical protein
MPSCRKGGCLESGWTSAMESADITEVGSTVGVHVPSLAIKLNGSETRLLQLASGSNHIGRSPINDYPIDDPTVSARHCEIMVTSERVMVRDLGSTNGTFIDDQPVRECVLLHGQTLRLGRVEMALDARAVEISIPVLSNPGKVNPALAEGLAACANHEASAATVECMQCNKAFCDLCVHQIRRVGGAALALCPSCSGHCRPIAIDHPVTPKRRSRISSWIGNVTAKMTGRFARSGPG